MKLKFFSELFGTAFLLAIVVGSGIMGESLSGGNPALTLLVNSLATGAGLFVLIQSLGSISGAHFNPAVSLVEMLWGRLTKKEFYLYIVAQVAGALIGVLAAHAMFDQNLIQLSSKVRFSPHLWCSEIIATFGLICTIALAGRKHVEFAPMSIASYIMAAYWFTSSTSFANPAATVARALTNTFTGISPIGILPFIGAQLLGSLGAYFILRKFIKD